jgi:4-methyl-5(b-hydroxyethyl)-thiazole monophosphate biosynthesis
MPSVLIPLAQGCEEVEAVTLIDLLRRAGIEVTTAGLDAKNVRGSHGIVLVPDTNLDAALKKNYDMVVLPGGLPGADNLGEDKRLTDLLVKMAESGKFVGAICAAPRVLAQQGLLDGKKATAYPGFLEAKDYPKVHATGAPVECDGKILTSRGPGTAMDFALAIIAALLGDKKRDDVETALVRP